MPEGIAMPSGKELKSRMESIRDTLKITNAMYLISSAKLRRAREQHNKVSGYFNTMRSTLARVLLHIPPDQYHPYVSPCQKPNPRRAYVVLTADKGMAGAFNANVIKFAAQLCQGEEQARLYVIGQTGYRHFLGRDKRLVREFCYGGEAPTLQRARHITFELMDAFRNGEVDEIDLVYTRMKNALTAEPVRVPLIPFCPGRLRGVRPVGPDALRRGLSAHPGQ